MVQKKQTTFTEITDNVFEEALNKLTEEAKPAWGIMTPQHMIEHLEMGYRIAAGEIQDFKVATPEKYIDEVQETLWNYEPMPKKL